jgi:hypothetical protein
MADPGPGDGPPRPKIKPEVEIAWVRAVARAFDDPAYYRRLKANPAAVLSELGADVSGIDVRHEVEHGGFTPSLAALDEVNKDLEMKRDALRAAEASSYQPPSRSASWSTSAPDQSLQSMPAYPTSIHIHVPALGSSVQSCSATGCMTVQTYASSGCASFRLACIAASQVATTRPSASPGDAAPQWIGGRPSGGAALSA